MSSLRMLSITMQQDNKLSLKGLITPIQFMEKWTKKGEQRNRLLTHSYIKGHMIRKSIKSVDESEAEAAKTESERSRKADRHIIVLFCFLLFLQSTSRKKVYS